MGYGWSEAPFGSSLLVAAASWVGAWTGASPFGASRGSPVSCPSCPACTACPACPACQATAHCAGEGTGIAGWSSFALAASLVLGAAAGSLAVYGCGWCRSRWRVGLASEGGLGAGPPPPPLRASLGPLERALPRLANLADRGSTASGSATPSEAGDSVWVPRRRNIK